MVFDLHRAVFCVAMKAVAKLCPSFVAAFLHSKNDVGQCNVDGWKLFDDCYSLIEKYKSFAKKSKVKIEEKSAMQEQQRKYKMNNLCQYCGGPFKGLFTKKCAKCGKVKDYITI